MDQDLNENLLKLNQLMRKQSLKKITLQPSKYAHMNLMLARSISISTQSSSRFIQNKSNQNTQNTSQAIYNNQEKYFVSRRASLAKQLKNCDSYVEKHIIEKKFTKVDNVCGLRKVFEICSTNV